MYFNKNKEDTNIDNEFKSNKKIEFDFEKYKKPLIIVGAIILLLIIIIIIASISSSAKKNAKKYYINLDGPQEMAIGKGTTFTDPGYSGYDNKNNKYDVTVTGEVDTTKAGIYEITYTLRNVTKTRRVKVVEAPNELTTIHLNGGKNITIKKGTAYEEKGYSAVDFNDGNLTSSVKVSGSVDTTKAGIYRLIYSVTNSKGITTVETRVITVE